MRLNFRLLRSKIGELNGQLQDNISGIRVIKGFTRELYELTRFNKKVESGKHDQLLLENGLYTKLYKMQFRLQ